nr:hypothetical protein BaRGS_001279 [Batillaria attramentaria]
MAAFARGFNHSPMQRHKNQLRKQKDDFQSRLADFPHSFQMSDQEFITENALKSLKNHLEAALKAGYKTDTERAQSLNLLAYTLFRLKDRKEALKRVDEVLEMESQRQNIVSLANKAVMLWDIACRRGEREQIVMQLENLRDEENFKYLKVKAKAEMASSYMRLGPRYKKYAIDLFDEVIPEGREPEVWSWKLALATAHRHTLDLQHAPFVSEEEENHKHLTEEELQKHFTVLQMLNEIINGTAGQDLKANAYAEIAMVLQSTWDPKAEQRLCDAAHTGIMKACKDALKSDDSEPSVLWKTGKCFRYKKDVHKSLELLQKAVKLQPSSAAYHHLGLTYKAFATEDKRGTLRRRRGRRLGGRRKGKRKKPDNCASGTDSESDVDTEEETVVHGKVGRLPKTVKSPPKGTTTFSWDDKYVRESVENLKESVRFSEKENTRAVYDLALMYKALGEFAEALRCLEDIYDKSEEDLSSSGPLEIVTAYEQAGLIKMEMAEIEKDKDRKRQLHNEADDMLGSALITASRLFEKSAQIQGQFAGVFQSPRALLQAVDNSGRSTQEKQKEKAKLLHLIQKHKKSLAVLRKMAASHREGDAECQMLLIQNLCKIGKFEEAVWSCRSPMQQIQREQDDFQKRLADFPHLFQLECQHLICRKTYQRLKNDLEAARKSGAGFKETEKIRRKEANQIVQKLEELRNTDGFHYLQVKAKAEMAADYMRFGHRFTEKAIDLYNKVIPEGREPEPYFAEKSPGGKSERMDVEFQMVDSDLSRRGSSGTIDPTADRDFAPKVQVLNLLRKEARAQL